MAAAQKYYKRVLNTESAKVHVVPHLPKASFSQHHQEIEIRKFHPISAPVVVEFRNGICCLLIRSLGPCSNLGSLQRWRWNREKREEITENSVEKGHYKTSECS